MRINDIIEDISRKQELIRTHERRLHSLQLTAARYGYETPSHIRLEIEDITETIGVLKEELRAFETILVNDDRIVHVQIIINGRLGDFTPELQQETVRSLVHTLNLASGQVSLSGIYPGSIIIRLKMPISGAARLAYLVESEGLIVQGLLVEQVSIEFQWPHFWLLLGVIGLVIGTVSAFLVTSTQGVASLVNRLLSWTAVFLMSIGFGVAIFFLRRGLKLGRSLEWRMGLIAAFFVAGMVLVLPSAIRPTIVQLPSETPTATSTARPTNTPRPTHVTATYTATATPTPTATPTLTATSTEAPPPTVTVIPTPTRTPKPKPTSTLSPTAVPTPTSTPQPVCPYQEATDEATIRRMIQAEAEAVVMGNGGLSIIRQIFAPDANILDRTKDVQSSSPEDFYTTKFADITFSEAQHPIIRQEQPKGSISPNDLIAVFRSTSTGRYESNRDGPGEYNNDNIDDADKWTFTKRAGCWVITEFSFK